MSLKKIKYKLFLQFPSLFSKFIYFLNAFKKNKYYFTNKIESISDIVECESSKIGLCIAYGPSLIPYLDKLRSISLNTNKQYCLLSVNKFEDQFKDIKVDYRIVANNFASVILNYDFYNIANTTLFYSDSVDCTNKKIVEKLLNINYLSYDQRHFFNNPCSPKANCCNQIVDNRLTIQEELMKYTKSKIFYSSGSTVSLHMLAFSILLGCKIIYLFGLDLNYKVGYVNVKITNKDSFEPYLDNILNDFKIINNMAKNIGVKIYSTCKNSPINNIFEYVENPFINI